MPVKLCRDFAGGDRFVVYLEDNILQHGIRGYLEEFLRGDMIFENLKPRSQTWLNRSNIHLQ
jgi:dTDP-glucose pyrophosphorylase